MIITSKTPTIQNLRPFNVRWIIRDGESIHGEDRRATHRTAACNYRYIMRQNGVDEFGPTPDFASRGDLLATGRIAPWPGLKEPYAGIAVWEAADEAARYRRPKSPTAIHAVGSLPEDGNPGSWRNIIAEVCEPLLAGRGMIVDWAIHCLPDGANGFKIKPHAHLLISARSWRRDRDPGAPRSLWLGSKAMADRLGNSWFAATKLYPTSYRSAAAAD